CARRLQLCAGGRRRRPRRARGAARRHDLLRRRGDGQRGSGDGGRRAAQRHSRSAPGDELTYLELPLAPDLSGLACPLDEVEDPVLPEEPMLLPEDDDPLAALPERLPY